MDLLVLLTQLYFHYHKVLLSMSCYTFVLILFSGLLHLCIYTDITALDTVPMCTYTAFTYYVHTKYRGIRDSYYKVGPNIKYEMASNILELKTFFELNSKYLTSTFIAFLLRNYLGSTNKLELF